MRKRRCDSSATNTDNGSALQCQESDGEEEITVNAQNLERKMKSANQKLGGFSELFPMELLATVGSITQCVRASFQQRRRHLAATAAIVVTNAVAPTAHAAAAAAAAAATGAGAGAGGGGGGGAKRKEQWVNCHELSHKDKAWNWVLWRSVCVLLGCIRRSWKPAHRAVRLVIYQVAGASRIPREYVRQEKVPRPRRL